MMGRTVFAVVAALFLALGANAQDEEPNAYFWANKQKVGATVVDNLVAVRFLVEPETGLVDSTRKRTDGLEALATERFQTLRPDKVVAYTVPAGSEITMRFLADLQADLSDLDAAVADVGRVVITSTGALAVMTDQLSIGFSEGVKGLDHIPLRVGESGRLVSDLVSVIRTLNAAPLVVSYRVKPESALNALEIANAVYEHEQGRFVIYATPTLRFGRELRDIPNAPFYPNDILFPSQWHLDHQLFADVDAPEAWDYTRGSDTPPADGSCVVQNRVRIAVFDDGVETQHPDLKDNIAPGGRNYKTHPYGNDPNPDAQHMHGTRAAGVIAACGDNNNMGVSGVCPLCEILPIKINTHLTGNLVYALYDAVNELNV